MNKRLQQAGVPVRVANMSTVWTVLYDSPSRYNWMFQFYLRAEGLLLSWVGSGRMIFSLNYSAAEFDEVVERFCRAAQAMRRDGWWWDGSQLSNKEIRRGIFREMWARRRG
jgi:glutamate-1-semialdehyde 2,1-aminomutase